MNSHKTIIFDSLLRHLETHDRDFEILSSGVIKLRVCLDVCVHDLSIIISALDSGFSLQGIVPFIIPDEKRSPINSFINLVNTRQHMGSLVYHMDQQQLRYSHYCACDGIQGFPEAFFNNAVAHVTEFMTQYFPGICSLLFVGCPPTEAFRMCASHTPEADDYEPGHLYDFDDQFCFDDEVFPPKYDSPSLPEDRPGLEELLKQFGFMDEI